MASVAGRGNPCSAVNVQAHVVVPAQAAFAGVETHPHAHRLT